MDILSFKKHIPQDWERYRFLQAEATFAELKEAIEDVKRGHIAIIVIPKNNHFVIEEDIDINGYVSIFCDRNVVFLNDRDERGFTTGINLKNGVLNIFNGTIQTTQKPSYYGFFSGSGMVNTFDTNIEINQGSILTAGLLTDVLALNIHGGKVDRFGSGYLCEDMTGRDAPFVLNATFPNTIDEELISCTNITTNLFLPIRKEVN